MKSFPAQKVFKQRLHASMDDKSGFQDDDDLVYQPEVEALYTTLPEGISMDDLNLEQLYGLLSSLLTK